MAEAIDVIFSGIETITFIFQWFWWLIIFAALIVMKLRWKNWPLEAVIIEKRGNNLVKTNDRAGKYHDPYTNITGYRLQKARDTIPVINYDYVLHNAFKPTTIFEWITNKLRGNIGTIFFFRYGTKQYKPIKIKEKGELKTILNEMKGDNGNPIYVNIYEPLDPRDKLGMLDFEVVDWDNMNFMVQEQRASIIRRQKSGEWVKTMLIPVLLIGAAVIVSIIMIKYGYDYAMSLKTGASPAPPPEKATVPDIPIIGDILPGK